MPSTDTLFCNSKFLKPATIKAKRFTNPVTINTTPNATGAYETLLSDIISLKLVSSFVAPFASTICINVEHSVATTSTTDSR